MQIEIAKAARLGQAFENYDVQKVEENVVVTKACRWNFL